MSKPRATKVATNASPPREDSARKSQRRILRPVADWEHVSCIIAAGGEANLVDVAFLLRLGEPVPPDIQNYLADWLDPPPKERGRPKKYPGQIKSDQWKSARSLYDAINKIRTDRRISLARAFTAHAANRRSAKSVEREYRAAKKLLVADLEQLNTPTQQHFLSQEDYEQKLKKRKNK
jgi:hypothetical protein